MRMQRKFQLDDTRSGHVLEAGVTEVHRISQDKRCIVQWSTGGFENNWYATLIQMASDW